MPPKIIRMHATLALPTGRLIVADPGALFGDAKPLDLALPPGEYPVTVGPSGVELRIAGAAADGADGATDDAADDAGDAAGTAADAEAVHWEPAAPGFDAPSGYVCLLDESALKEFTDLGDEPVDEYELLTERLRDHPGEPVEFRGLLVFPIGNVGRVRELRAGCDRTGRCTRITAEF